MAVLERSELQASPLADLHAIADQLGLDGFRRLRKAELIDAILGEEGSAGADSGETATTEDDDQGGDSGAAASVEDDEEPDSGPAPTARPRRRSGRASTPRPRRAKVPREADGEKAAADRGDRDAGPATSAERVAEGVVELLGNGSAFLRIDPPEPSDDDVYISAAQVRRCELVSGDRVTGPIRTPRRSERYPSLIRVDTINGASADSVSEGTRYEDLPVAYPSVRLALGSEDPTLEAIEWLTPLGRGSRAVIVGAPHAGKTETLRRLLAAVSTSDDLEITLVLLGARPEEIAEWQEGPVAPSAALGLASSADAQLQALERALDAARRVAARGSDALVLIDSLDGLSPQAARKALAAARNLKDAGSLTVIATATRPFGGETTVIALDVALTSTGRQPILDLVGSATLRPELLVGDEGARAIMQARATAMDAAG